MKLIRKASISLSINAVVVLVLAVAMLGLGLAFSIKMFSRFGDTLIVPEPQLTATADDQLVLVSDIIKIPITKSVSLPIRYYAKQSRIDYGVYPIIVCGADYVFGTHQFITQGQEKQWRILLSATSLGLQPGIVEDRICTVIMCGKHKWGNDPFPPNPCTSNPYGPPIGPFQDATRQVTVRLA